jgi:hypothetical protein
VPIPAATAAKSVSGGVPLLLAEATIQGTPEAAIIARAPAWPGTRMATVGYSGKVSRRPCWVGLRRR